MSIPTARIEALRRILIERDLDAIALVPGSNMIYFTGLHLHLSERPFIALFTRTGLGFIIPRLELPQLALVPELAPIPFAWSDETGYRGAFAAALAELRIRRLGVDGMTMRVTESLTFQSLDPALTITPVEADLVRIRAVKDADEIAAIRAAIRITEAALADLLGEIRPGMTERQIAARFVELQAGHAVGVSGFDRAFELVQAGVNSSNPHGALTDRAVQAGDFLLLDVGCAVGGYPSDITRTVVVGDPTADMRRIYETVLAANSAARAAAGPGVAMKAVDQAARAVIEAAGYGPFFTHRTGHGLGLGGHEPIPQIAANVDDRLQPGMTFTIEPGIYIPEIGGVRIEDDMLVTETGCESLTTFPRELRVL
jgi:Xaa-Pro dipeptidase